MKRNTKIVAAVAVVLVAIVAVFAWLNRDYISERRALQDSGSFAVTAGEKTFTVTMDDIKALSPRSAQANYKTNGKEPVAKTYTGVPLIEVLDSLGIDYSAAKSVSFTALDGYASAVAVAEALDSESCYIIIEEEGAPLGTKESGGNGPFMMILAKDSFSQRWCKFLMEISIS